MDWERTESIQKTWILIISLIKILTRSNVYTDVRFFYKRVQNSKFEFINIRKLIERKTQLPSTFYCLLLSPII